MRRSGQGTTRYVPFFLRAVRNRESDFRRLTGDAAGDGDSANWPARFPAARHTVMPDDHSEVVPLLPIPNRTVKRLSADDSADSRVKVGHRQAINLQKA